MRGWIACVDVTDEPSYNGSWSLLEQAASKARHETRVVRKNAVFVMVLFFFIVIDKKYFLFAGRF